MAAMKKAPAAPPALARALARNHLARDAWDRISPSHKKEYATWIAGAKKEDTRARRVEQAVLLLARGTKTPLRPNDAPAVSNAPLARKLGVKEGLRAVVFGAPEGWEAAGLRAPSKGKGDVVLVFVRDTAALAVALQEAGAAVADGGKVWIAYPKKTSGMKTDLSRDRLHAEAGRMGWEGVSLVAVDEAWSAMRVTRRG